MNDTENVIRETLVKTPTKPKIGIVEYKDMAMGFNNISEIEEGEIVSVKEYAQLIGFRLNKGQKVFEINHDTFMVGLADTLPFRVGVVKVTPKPRHCYCVALNKDNAIRKYTKMMLKLLNDAKNKQL